MVLPTSRGLERDRAVTTIQHQHGLVFTQNMSTAHKFALEWPTVLSVSHRTARLVVLPSVFRGFVRIHTGRILSLIDDHAFIVDFTEAIVFSAIAGPSRHNIRGIGCP